MSRWMKPIVCILLAFVLVSCARKESAVRRLTISVIPKGTTHVFWKSIHAGAVKASKEFDVDIIWVGTEREDDRQRQIALVDNQVMNRVDGIVLAPLDAMALRRPVRAAVDKKVPVVIIDSGLENSENIYVSFVSTDNYRGGYIAGIELGRLLEGEGKVILLRYQEGSASTENRERGFLDAIGEYPGIEVISDEQYGGATTAQAQQASENLILRFKDAQGELTADGIFCPNESTTYGMLQALRRHRLAGKVKFVGFDSSQWLLDGVRKGEISGLVVQNPFAMGYLGVKTMVMHLKGEEVDKRIDTGVKYVGLEELESAEIQELVSPDLEKWLGPQ